MTPEAPFTPSETLPPQDLPSRILASAQRFLFTEGPASLTMEALAGELGISKKTLYVHFPGKDAILCGIVELMAGRMRAKLEGILADKNLGSPEKLCAFIDAVGTATARLTPGFLREMQRNAPAAYERIDAIRRKNIPYFFGRLLREGMNEGTIRRDIDPDFACEFWLQAMRGMMTPEVLERTQLSTKQTLERAINLYFNGLLTPLGHNRYASHLAACGKHGKP